MLLRKYAVPKVNKMAADAMSFILRVSQAAFNQHEPIYGYYQVNEINSYQEDLEMA